MIWFGLICSLEVDVTHIPPQSRRLKLTRAWHFSAIVHQPQISSKSFPARPISYQKLEMSGARTHGSLTKDEEVNAAAWAAGRGAVVGAAKVCLAMRVQ